MSFFILMLTLVYESPLYEIKETGVFKPFRLDQAQKHVAISADGAVYLLDTAEKELRKYGSDGKAVRIAKKGQGPGELRRPNHVCIEGERIFVTEGGFGYQSVNEYDGEGKFVKVVRLTGHVSSPVKVHQGWVTGNWFFSPDPTAPIEFTRFDEDLKNPSVLSSWPRVKNVGVSVEMEAGSVPTMPHNPAPENHFMAVSLDGAYLYVYVPAPKLKILMFDMKTLSPLKTITRDITPVPFDEDWGQTQFEAFKQRVEERNKAQGIPMKFKAVFPEDFPIARGMFVAADGSLVLSRWVGRPDKNTEYLMFDKDGNTAESSLSQESLTRVIAIRDGNAWITTFDGERAGIAVCKLDDANRFAAQNPVVQVETGGGGVINQ